MLRRTSALVAAAVLLAGCTAEGPASAPDAAPDAATTTQAPPPVDYVALGDSYTAGPLISTVRSDPSGCARSTNNYPAFLAEWLEVRTYRDVSCSGAATTDLTAPQQLLYGGTTTPPQQRALSPETELVTVGLGGNDFDLFARMSGCAGDLAAPGAVCDLDEPALLRDAARVEARLADALAQVARRAPEADVVVVGYPQVAPPRGTCRALGVDAEQAGIARRVADRLNASVRAAARQAGATWVDLHPVSAGHDACAGKDAWVTGADYVPGQPAPLHPRVAGMRAAAAAVLEAVTGERPPAGAGPTAAPAPDAVIRNPQPR